MSQADTPPPAPQGHTFDDVAAFADVLAASRRLIGIDAGTKTLGLALSDIDCFIASPLENAFTSASIAFVPASAACNSS